MKIRESGMPERELWETFFEPEKILVALGLDDGIADAAEFGCGYGTFTIPAARIIRGGMHAFDIEPEMVRLTNEAAAQHGLRNVKAVRRDFMAQGSGLSDASVDYVMLFNILHLEDPDRLLREAARILKDHGRLGIIHWNHDPKTPRGPSLPIRPRPQDCIRWAKAAGFSGPVQHDLKPHHYGILLRRRRP
jgi:SAM-dependent methyltransferase